MEPALIAGQAGPRGELADAVEDRARPRDILEPEVGLERLVVEAAGDEWKLEQGFQLGSERERLAVVEVVERLDAEAVASGEQAPPARVPQGKGEHAAQPVDAVLA